MTLRRGPRAHSLFFAGGHTSKTVPMEKTMTRFRIVFVAGLAALAGCAPQQGPAPADEYVPHGRGPAATPLVQALRDCRFQVESAGRQSAPPTGPGPLRQIPEPPPFACSAYPTVEACMHAKGYRRAAPAR